MSRAPRPKSIHELAQRAAQTPSGIEGVAFPGPYPVGVYAYQLQSFLRERARVQVFGEVVNLKVGRAKAWFELRDARGALPCSMWRHDLEAAGLHAAALVDGMQVVAAGGPDYYPGNRTSSPSFTFQVDTLRVAGEGDLLAELDRLRKLLHAEGLFEPQKRLRRPPLPRTIGVVTGRGGKARDDVLAGLRRRGWAGRLVWGFAPVQDRHAAAAISAALRELAALEQVEVIIVARGGGSLSDLFAFCDEQLCRTVSLLRVPVIASVGHHTDRTLIDDVAAVSCSTPTHAAEAAVPVHCGEARLALTAATRRLHGDGRRAVLDRARILDARSRVFGEHVAQHRAQLRQHARELRAGSRRRLTTARDRNADQLVTLARKARAAGSASERGANELRASAVSLGRAAPAALERRRRDLERLTLALDAHDPERALQRGYALVEDTAGELVATAAAARAASRVRLRFSDGRVDATVGARPRPRKRQQADQSQLFPEDSTEEGA